MFKSSGRMCRYILTLLLLTTLPSPSLTAQTNSNRQNWFHDPFFQISDAIPNCPMPAGPFVTVQERTAEAHHRAERGTTCWLAGKCDRPSSYDYDKDIASAIKSALNANNPFHESTLWVTVQGRVVYIEGCVGDRTMAAKLETFVMKLPFVEIAVAKVRSDPSAQPPYKVF